MAKKMAKKLAEMDWNEHEELAKLLAPWLESYTAEVIGRVIDQMDDILANETAMMMIRELGERKEKEKEDFRRSLMFTFRSKAEKDDDGYRIHLNNIHNHCLEHSNAYRDVLCDMYIQKE